jgi:hypothetical protein
MARVGFREAMGLRPVGRRLREAVVALRGAEGIPPSRFDTTSLSQLRPRLGVPLWRGRPAVPGKVVLTNLFNHDPTPIEEGWSVRRRQVRDFRGGDLTYDSHNGTDLAVPIGTPVLTAAPGRVVLLRSDFNRGGHKVFVDHGDGLMTVYAHLARVLVREGQRVERGGRLALSGYSGLDGLVTFPFGVPHVHFNVWLDGEPVDPFPHGDQPPLWHGGERPVPPPAADPGSDPGDSSHDEAALERAIAACTVAGLRRELAALTPTWRRAAAVVAAQNYEPTRFTERVCIYAERHPRTPRLDLPFAAADVDGVVFADAL